MRARVPLVAVLLSAAVLLLASAPAPARDRVLARDSGTMESKQSSAGTGHVVTFEAPKGKWWIKAIRVHGARYGGGYDPAATTFVAAVCDARLKPLASGRHPYELFRSGRFEWVEIDLDEPIPARKVFKLVVGFEPTQRRGVYVAWAKTTDSHSGYGLPGGAERPAEKDREWMIRAVLTDKPPKAAGDEVELALDDGEPTGKESFGDGGHVIEFRKPAGTWWVKTVRVHGQRYGGDPAATPFSVSVCSTSMKPLHREEARYALFGGEPAWADVPLRAALKAPSRFRVVVDFDASATRGVFVDYTKARVSHSKVGDAGGDARPFKKGEWMIRVILVRKKPDLPDAKPPVRASYVDDLAFLEKTVRERYPALAKKGIDWDAAVHAARPAFAACKDDWIHVRNVTKLLAVLGDSHTGISNAKAPWRSPAFDGLFGAGMWIATSPDGRRRVIRAMMPGHALASRLGPGDELIEIDGRPAAIVHEEVRRRLREWLGWSSTHFQDARLSFQFFPFGEKKTLPARFLKPDGEVVDVSLPRWGPGGKGLTRIRASMPAGVEVTGPVVAARLEGDLGYLRIVSGMGEGTRKAFFEAFDTLKGVKGILLDCRGMGGGGDGPAWAMAGRFFAKSTPQGSAPPLKSDGWAFEGPVVMLQDEREVSSAETFTWAMAETGRAVTVGRPTGGATIIPRSFTLPSGLVSFRMGVHDRKTPVRGVQPEGFGSAPDVFVPYDQALLAIHGDPEIGIGTDVLRRLVAGENRKAVVDLWAGFLAGDAHRFSAARLARSDGRMPAAGLGDLVARIVECEVARIECQENLMPGFAASASRLRALAGLAKLCDRTKVKIRAMTAVERLAPEIAAEEALTTLLAGPLPPPRKALDAFLGKHGDTRSGNAARQAFPE